MRLFNQIAVGFAILLSMAATATAASRAGDDVVRAFARAHEGYPLRVVVLGGSITQAGGGWIGPWLREQFPHSVSSLANAGMSATGSGLGVFRLQRDVLSIQPDLVLLETTVNDDGSNDDDVLRNVESIVVRLKQQSPPAAVAIVHSASATPLNKNRHSAVARHYGLLEIDLDVALKEHLQREGRQWAEFMSDAVHPNATGHSFYARTIASALQPLVARTRTVPSTASGHQLPPPLSPLPLLLDATVVPLRALAQPHNGWNAQSMLTDTATGGTPWWNQFFNGVLSGEAPGATLEISFRGSTVGLFYALQPGFGSFYASVDGAQPRVIATGVRDGYESTILSQNLSPGEHRLTIVLPPESGAKRGPVKLGALLIAGADSIRSEALPVPLGAYTASRLQRLKFVPLLPAQWRIAGPFGTGEAPVAGGHSRDLDTSFEPEKNVAGARWRPMDDDGSHGEVLNFTRVGEKPRGVHYAIASLHSPQGGAALMQMTLDYFARIWLNGREVVVVRGTHGHPRSPLLFPVTLRPGENRIMVKLHPGSGGSDFSLAIAEVPYL